MGDRDPVVRKSSNQESDSPQADASHGIDRIFASSALFPHSSYQEIGLPKLSEIGAYDSLNLGLRRPSENRFLTPVLDQLHQDSQMRNFGIASTRGEFEQALRSSGLHPEQPVLNDYFSARVEPDFLTMSSVFPIQADPVHGRYLVRLLDDRSTLPMDVDLHLAVSPLQLSSPGDQEFKYRFGDDRLRFLFQRGSQPEERSLFGQINENGMDDLGPEFMRFGRLEDQHLVLGMHRDNTHLMLDHSGTETVLGGIWDKPDSVGLVSFAYTQRHGEKFAGMRESYALGVLRPEIKMELTYTPGDERRPISGYILPTALGLDQLRVGPVLEFDKNLKAGNPFESPLTGFLIEHQGRHGQLNVRGVFGPDNKGSINAGWYLRY